MVKFELDWSDVAKVVMPDPNRLPLEGNKDRLVRVAFDLFRLKGDSTEDLWQIQADDDGNEFLVRTYNLPEDEQQVVKSSDWRVILDAKGSNLTVLYKDTPIHRLAASIVDANTTEDVELFRQTMQEKLSTDDTFVSKFVSSIPKEKYELLSAAGIFDTKISDPLGLGSEFRQDRKRAEHKKKTEVQKDIGEILKDIATKSKEKKQDSSDEELSEMVMKKTIPSSNEEIETDLWMITPEDRAGLERALKDIEVPDVMTSAKISKVRFPLSKRAEDATVGNDLLLQKLETINMTLGDVLSETDEEEV